jgi:DNA-binding CsgD family transcriptional regulator
MDRQTFSDLVCAIYDGATDPTLWPQTLGLICGTFGFRKGTVDLNRVPGMVNLLNFHHGIDDQQAATMVSHYGAMPEVWGGLTAAMTRPIDRPWVVSRIMTQEALRLTDYYRNWVGPMGLVDGAAIVLARDKSLFGSIRVATDDKRGIIDDGLIDALALLLPHCQRAARISGLLDASRTTARNFQTVIDAISVPIILLSVECAIVHANPRAKVLLNEGVILASNKGRLASLVPNLQQAISHTIRRLALDETDIPGGGAGLSIRAPDGSARTLHLLPLAQGATRVKLAGDAVAAVFVSSASVQEDLAREALKSMFELTQTELGVLERILVGKSTQKIAAELGIASSTVRTHVMHLFQKTDTHNRADLVRLAHGLEQPVAR